jgi:hypothetical protein
VTRWRAGGGNGPKPPALVSFLLARLDDDEAAALAAQAAIHAAAIRQADRSPFPDSSPSGDQVLNGHAVAGHVSRHSPDRVLREIAAKRAVILLWWSVLTAELTDPHPARVVEALETAMAELAAVYTDDPGFQPAWLPHGPLNRPESPEPASGRGTGPAPGNVIPFRSGSGRQPTADE